MAAQRWSPWGHLAERPHIRLERAYLDDGYLGLSEPGVIYLDHRQCRRQARSTLAHELAHHDLGHVESDPTSRYDRTRRELQADRWAALRLVTLEALADAVMWCHRGDVGQIAEALNVDEDTMLLRLNLARRDKTERAHIARRLALREGAA